MTNKKLWLSLLAVVLIVCMISVGLVSCKKKVEPEEPEEEEEETIESKALSAIVSGIQKSVAAGEMTDLRLDGTVGLTVNDKAYEVALALDLDLRQFKGYKYTKATTFSSDEEYFYVVDPEADEKEYAKADNLKETDFAQGTYYTRSKQNKETSDTSNTALCAEIREGEDVILGAYYQDAAKKSQVSDPYQGNYFFVQTEDKQVAFPAPFVMATMKALDASVDFSNIDLDDDDVWGGADAILSVVAGLAEQGEYTEGKSASVTINLASVIDSFGSVLKGTQGYFDALDLNINAEELGKLLPAISIKISADLDSTGMLTGVELSLVIAEKDIEIKNKTSQETFLKVDMTKDLKIGLSLDYTIYGTDDEPNYFFPDDLSDYNKQTNILDLELTAELDLQADISYSLELNGNTMTLAVPAGYYALTAKVAANPFAILQYLDKSNPKYLDFSSTAKIISSIETILEAVSSVQLNLVRFDTAAKRTSNTDGEVKLNLVLADTYTQVDTKYQKGAKAVTINAGIISGSQSIELNNASISAAIDLAKKFIPKAGEANLNGPSADDDEDSQKIMNILTTVGKYLRGAYIGINDGDHGAVYAEFDTADTEYKVIPFSGYTEWTGATKNPDKWTYYVIDDSKESGYILDTAAYSGTKTYYVWKDNVWETVAADAEFDDMRVYYVKDGETYKRAQSGDKDITAFAPNTTYYICKEAAHFEKVEISSKATGTDYYVYVEPTYKAVPKTTDFSTGKYYVKGLSDEGGEFGLGLSASIDIDKDSEDKLALEINATITNLDFMGFANSITARIGGLDAELWNNSFPIFISDGTTTTIGSYSTVNGKIQKTTV